MSNLSEEITYKEKFKDEKKLLKEAERLSHAGVEGSINNVVIQCLLDLYYKQQYNFNELEELYNNEKEKNKEFINTINDLQKQCNKENKRCSELTIELKELEKYKSGYELLQAGLDNYINKDKVKEWLTYNFEKSAYNFELTNDEELHKLIEV